VPGGALRAQQAGARPATGDESDRLQVGLQPDGRIVVPTNQILRPAGRQVTFPGRPVDLRLLPDGKTLVVKNRNNLLVIDVESGGIRQTLPMPGAPGAPVGNSVVGLAVSNDGQRIYASDVRSGVHLARRGPDGRFDWVGAISLAAPDVGGAAAPAGIALAEHGKLLYVTSTRGNNVQRFELAADPTTGSVTTGRARDPIAVGVAPYTIVLASDTKAYVSNWGGDRPAAGQPSAPSSKTATRIDPATGVANHGSVSVIDLAAGCQTRTIEVGLHPCGMVLSPDHRFLFVANANSDTVSVIDTAGDRVVETIDTRPNARLPFGSGSNALAINRSGDTLYVANGTNNCIAVVQLGASSSSRPAAGDRSRVAGLIPTGWYPGALCLDESDDRIARLYVANVKGHGSLSPPANRAGHNSHDHLGSVSLIDLPAADRLELFTAEVGRNNRLALSMNGLAPPRQGVPAAVVPERHGEPSLVEHVVYIIKENRTYDQVLGDLPRGNGEPKLVLFGQEVTPNHHALASEFVLLDNFYCSGVLSADGHAWSTEAYVTDYLEKAFGGFVRSYPFDGDDPLAYAASGFLWDNALRHERTIRVYGEFVKTQLTPAGAKFTDLLADYRNGTNRVQVRVVPGVHTLKPYVCPTFAGFGGTVPDVYRAREFLRELKEFESQGKLPNLIVMTLPNDHTVGTRPGLPTPRACVADNDRALGEVVEALSRSRFWPRMAIFVVEDDPQNGFDHVDGHRTVAFVISPYTRRRVVDSTNYNQTGMVKTMELMLGIPPMNQMDLSATAMRGCFQATADLTPYEAKPISIALDETNPPLGQLRGPQLYWAQQSLELELDEVDEADEDTFNRVLWHYVKGYDVPYPARRDADNDD
jgi:YVTN family beta-propeller protein